MRLLIDLECGRGWCRALGDVPTRCHGVVCP